MPRAYVLMTAMPPTKGHLQLIQFAKSLPVSSVEVILSTQPTEPFSYERVTAMQEAVRGLGNVNVHHIHRELPQEPQEATGFWDMWVDFLTLFGLQSTDYIVASEKYGLKLAELTGAKFVPYDLDRQTRSQRATTVRDNLIENFDMILPEFQRHLTMRVTIYGAESCGKTTLTKALGRVLPAWTLTEWARPYLELIGPEKLDSEAMRAIAEGQAALQRSAEYLRDRPFIIQDTDLYSTLGYWWNRPSFETIPDSLYNDADALKSDLYILCPSNIPFEADPLRYGGDEREASDQYWRDIADDEFLPMIELEESSEGGRLHEALGHIITAYTNVFASKIKFDRHQS